MKLSNLKVNEIGMFLEGLHKSKPFIVVSKDTVYTNVRLKGENRIFSYIMENNDPEIIYRGKDNAHKEINWDLFNGNTIKLNYMKKNETGRFLEEPYFGKRFIIKSYCVEVGIIIILMEDTSEIRFKLDNHNPEVERIGTGEIVTLIKWKDE